MSEAWKPGDWARTDRPITGRFRTTHNVQLIERDERRPNRWAVALVGDRRDQVSLCEDEFHREDAQASRKGQGRDYFVSHLLRVAADINPHVSISHVPNSHPATDATVQAIVAWQRANHQDRKVAIHLTGHVIEAHVTVIPSLATRKVKFRAPVAPEVVGTLLDMAARTGLDCVVDAGGAALAADLRLLDGD